VKKLLLILLLIGDCKAAERVLDFHSDIRIAADGALTVTEVVAVQAEGRDIRRGILRDFPTDYRDARGARVIVPFEVLRVTRDDAPEPYRLERLSNGVRVRIGNPDVLLPYGRHTYEIRYRTARQIGYFGDHDELYWNVNGNGWTFAFDSISAEVRLPSSVPAASLQAEAYTGPVGARGRSYEAFVQDGAAAWRSTRGFAPHEGMTIVLSFPKGIVARPTPMRRLSWFFAANKGVLAGLGGACLLFAFLYWRWSAVGRDPQAGPRFPRYDPPPGLGPAAVRFVSKMGCDDRCFAAGLLGLGQRGFLKIRQEGRSFSVERTGQQVDFLPGDAALADMLRAPGHPLLLSRAHDLGVEQARKSFALLLENKYGGGGLFSKNSGSMVLGVVIAAATLGAMHLLDAPALFLFALGGAMALLLLFFGRIMPAYSALGRKLEDHIDGLKLYLSVAEADELRRMKAPPQTAEEFARLLPYAVALEVEKTWADRFTRLLGLAAVAAAAGSYYTSDSGFASLGSHGVAESLSGFGETVSAASTPPGSSSGGSDGGGGGGSSGGGGGGGGGSGW
jgi:uncharacterized membrane protein YgcG